MEWVVAASLANRRRISLMVKGISLRASGWKRLRSRAAITVRMAWASMTRVVCRYQEAQRRTWCSSSPVAFLLVRNVGFDAPTGAGHPGWAG
jgi:hypothetical protein